MRRWLYMASVLAALTGATALPARAGVRLQPAAAPTGVQAPTDPRVQAILDTLRIAEHRGMNGVILVRSRNRVLLHEPFGWADREAGRRMTVETGFDIGSIVKPMTKCALLKLEEQGRLSLSDTLGKFFPEAPPDKRGITLAGVVGHRSGLPDVFGADYDVVSQEWLIRRAMQAKLLFAPGSDVRYSNSGYSLLAIVIERVSGRPFESFVRREVLAPAGIDRIGYVMAGWTGERLAVGYDGAKRWGTPLDHRWAKDGPGWNLRGNGGMLATVLDLCAWYEALFDGRIIGPAALEQFLAGCGTSRLVGGTACAHAGGNGVFNSLQISYVDADFHMTFFTATSDHQAEDVWKEFRTTMSALAREAKAGGVER